jgi:glyoxylase-like metal-dependent hydrolase (beta-lactamase superfamily II)
MIPTISEIAMPDPRVKMFRSDPEVDCFAVATERYMVVIDTFGTPEEALQMMEMLESKLQGRQLLVINTHQHYDHAWGNAIFEPYGRYPAPILAHQKSMDELPAARRKLEQKQTDPRFSNVKIIAPTLTFSQRFTIQGGDLTLELIPAPGHCEDQVVIWIPEIKTLLAADALEFPFPYAANLADLPVMLQTMRELKVLGVEVILPCHGGIHGPDLIDKNLEYFTRIKLEQLSFEDAVCWLRLQPENVSDLYRRFHKSNLEAVQLL